MIVEIPVILVQAGTASSALTLIAAGIAASVLLIDYAFDRVKEPGRRKE